MITVHMYEIFSNPYTTANNSHSIFDYLDSVGVKALKEKAIGFPD